MVENTIDIDGAQNYSYSIKSDFDPDLQEAKERSDNIEEEIQSLLTKVISIFISDFFLNLILLLIIQITDDIEAHNTDLKLKNQYLNDQYLSCFRDYEDKKKKIVDELIRIASEYNKSFDIKFLIFKILNFQLAIWTLFNI